MKNCKRILILAVVLLECCIAADLKVGNKCSTDLTDSNFKTVIESNDFVFVFFYSATCPACRRFDPIWEDLVCSLRDEHLVFGQLEGNENQGVINAYSVTNTPTLALFHRDMATPVKYSGQQYKEAMLYFLKSSLGYENPGSPAVHLETEEDAYRFSFWRGTVDGHLDPSLNGFFPTTDSPEYREFTKAAIELDGACRIGEIISETIQEAYDLPRGEPAIVMYRDYDERKSVFAGKWEASAIVAWTRELLHPTVGFADSQRISNYFRRNGVLVHLFVDPETVKGNWGAFQEYVFHEMVLPVVETKMMKREDLTIIFSDGKENAKWMSSAGLDPKQLPAAMLLDFDHDYKYQPRHPVQEETFAADVVQFINDFSLGMALPLREEFEGGGLVVGRCVEKEL